MKKRILSLILAITMFVGLLPTVSAAGEEVPEFSYDNFTITYDISGDLGATETPKEIIEYDLDYTNGFYKLGEVGSSTYSGLTYPYWYGDNRIFYKGTGENRNITAGNAYGLAVGVNVPVAGEYELNIKYATDNNGSRMNVYWGEVGITTTTGTYLGNYDCASEADNNFETLSGNRTFTINVENPGYYVILFFGQGKGNTMVGEEYQRSSFGSFTLKKGDGTGNAIIGSVDEAIALDMEDNTTKKLSVEGYLSKTGEEITAFKYYSSDTSVATVDENGNVTAVGTGEATIYATSADEEDNVSVPLSTTVTVTEKNGITVKYDIGGDLYEINRSIANISGTPDGQKLLTYDFSNEFYQYKAASSETNKNNIVVCIDGTKESGNIRVRANGSWIAFETYIPESGVYNMQIWHARNDKGTDADVYVTKADAWTSSNFGKKVDTYSSFDENTTYNPDYFTKIKPTPSVVEGIDITEAGKYVFTFHVPANANTDLYGSVGSFDLIAGKRTVAMNAKLQIESGRAILLALMSDNSFENFGEDVEITYVSSDPEIVEVDEGTGEITDKTHGKVEITATCEYEGKLYSDTVTYESEVIEDHDIKLTYDIGGGMYEINDSIAYISGTPDGQKWLTYDFSNNFYQYKAASSETNKNNIVVTIDWTEKSSNMRVRANGSWIAFEVYIPATGVYDMQMWHARNDKGTDADVYVAKADTWTSSEFGEKVGTYSSFDENTTYVPDYFGHIKPTPSVVEGIGIKEAGKYVITFHVPANSNTDLYGTVGSFDLISGDKTIAMGAKLQTERGRATLVAHMSDNSLENFGEDIEITYASSNPEIAEIDESTGKITDKAYGEVEITASCEYEGRTLSSSAKYIALDPNARGVDISVDLSGALAANGITSDGKVKFTEMNYNTTNGIWRFFSGSYDAHYGGRLDVSPKNISVRHGYSIAFEILIPEPGIYTMEMWPAINDEIIPINVFMAKGKASTAEADKVGFYDSVDPTVPYNPNYFGKITKTPVCVENIEVEEPGYYVFNFVGDASKYASEELYNYRRGTVGNFRLYSGTESTLMGGFYSENEEEVKYLIAYPDENVITYTDPVLKGSTIFNTLMKKLHGEIVEATFDSIILKSSDESIAFPSEGGIINAIGDGAFEVTSEAVYDGKTYKGTVPMSAYDDTGVVESELILPSEIYTREEIDTELAVIMQSGNRAVVPADVKIEYEYSPDGRVEIDENGMMKGISAGEVTVTATAFYKGAEVKASASTVVIHHEGKSAPTYYTKEKVATARDNIKKYSWAKSQSNTAIKKADLYLQNYEYLYDLFPHEGLPRSNYAAGSADDNYKYCRYCGEDVAGATIGGAGGWNVDIFNRPWKIQCPHCKRLFPSNDFETLYEYGLDEKGYYDADRAKKVNAEMVASGEGKNAYINELYPEVDEQLAPENGGAEGVKITLNNGRGLRPGETADGWGVDDGWGYRPKDENGKNYTTTAGDIEVHAYIPYYMKELIGTCSGAVAALADAYIYTGDERYGRAGAILFDIYAERTREYDMQIQYKKDGAILNTHAAGYYVGNISDAMGVASIVLASDALFPMKDDPQVISFLSAKAAELGLENDKTSGEKIWENWKALYREFFDGAKRGRLNSNFGILQGAIAACAVVLDEEPETGEMIRWVYAPSEEGAATITGGNVLAQLVNDVDRDGMGYECGDNYNVIWFQNLFEIANYFENYESEDSLNLWEYPKYPKMFTPYNSKVLVNTQLAQVGDSGGVAKRGFNGSTQDFLNAFRVLKEEPEMQEEARIVAQHIYLRQGYSLNGLNYGIFIENPESARDDLLEYIETTPEQVSEMLAGYGFAILRDGRDWISSSAQTAVNNLRDAWMYFGAAGSHSHSDNMTLGLEAFGLNIAPDNGYPERTGKDPNRYQWHNITLAHNTVMVNEKNSIKSATANGVPMHFDDSDEVKVMDIQGDCSYEETENYRRSLVMVKVDDDVSYTVDFFRVTGGDKHTYSFHSQAENAYVIDGLQMSEQKDEAGNWVGTYAYGPDKDGNIVKGVDVPYQDKAGSWEDANGNPYKFSSWGPDPWTADAWDYDTYFPRGYTWLSKIRRDEAPSNQFTVEFDVEDYRKSIKSTGDIKLRLTQLNSFTPSEVAIAGGLVPRKAENNGFPETFDYLLVHNEKQEGQEKLDSMFATVFEPYRDNRYIDSIVPCPVEGVDANDPTVRAIKITHKDGERIDYIIYSEDNEKELRIDNRFNFKGFIGVLSVNADGEAILQYINDGSYIGNVVTERDAYEGSIAGFDGEMNFGDFENYIDISLPGETIDDTLLADLAGRWIFIENDGVENAAYEIVSADKLTETTVRLNTGNVTNIRQYVNSLKPEEGYVYNFAEGDSFRIPVSYSDNSAPVFKPSSNLTTSAGSSITVNVNAESPLAGETVTYAAVTLPRGASLNSETGALTWKPDGSQVGDNHIAISATDSAGRQTITHFYITVYGSTTGSTSANKTDSTTEGTGASGTTGGGGGGGGGAAPTTPATPDTSDEETPNDDATTPDEGETSGEDAIGTDGDIRFVDLGNHAWAETAINELADAGIINGTSATTYSPANNITRADFALLLVRAFELESENAENFDDVEQSDYFASELAIARNAGIVSGIGDNKYAPRNTITRQDMMVIVYRALNSLPLEGKVSAELTDEVLSQYPDFAVVADYAKEAVSALISAELVNGKSGKIAPTDYTTRAEVAVLLKRILEYVK